MARFFDHDDWATSFELSERNGSVRMPNSLFLRYLCALGVTEERGPDSDDRRREFLVWYAVWGRPNLNDLVNESENLFAEPWAQFFFESCPGIEEANGIALPQIAQTVWKMRPDIQADPQQNIFDPKARLNFLRWFYLSWPSEIQMRIPHFEKESARSLRAIPGTPFSLKVADLLWSGTSDQYLDPHFTPAQNEFRRLAIAFRFSAVVDLVLTDDEIKLFATESPSGVPWFFELMFLDNPRFATEYDWNKPSERQRFVREFFDRAADEYKIADWIRDFFQGRPLSRPTKTYRSLANASYQAPSIVPSARQVTIVGFGNAAIGTGEDTRTLAKSLKAAGLDINIYSIQIQGNDSFQREGLTYSNEISESLVVFAMPPINTATCLLTHGPNLFKSKKVIGYWPWETSEWKQDYAWVEDFIDEIWGISNFSAQAFHAHLSKPVYVLPLPLDMPKAPSASKTRDVFRFYFNFDFNSSLTRKNPQATIRAFKQAFPENEAVELQLKVMHIDPQSAPWKSIETLIAGDPRINVVSGEFSYSDNLSFLLNSDCYVSAHRGEGFGRTIAEAFWYGIPTICSAYSGNLDFCRPENSYLVSGQTVEVRPGEYPFAAGTLWFDPDLEFLSAQMREVFENPNAARKKAEIARSDIKKLSDIDICSQRFLRRIGAL